MNKRIILPVLFLIMFISCKEKLVFYERSQAEIYYPLQIGNTWYYDNVMRSDRYTPANPYLKKVVEDKVRINEKTYFVISNTWDFSVFTI